MLRKFIIREAACTDPNLDISRLKEYNRLDLLCRTISDSLFVSLNLRENVVFYAVLDGPPNPPATIVFDSRSMAGMSESEADVAKMIKLCLKKAAHMKSGESADVSNGITVQKRGFEPIIKEEAQRCDLYYLEKRGEDIRDIKISAEKDALFIVGGHEEMKRRQEDFIERFSPKRISVGPRMVFSSHAITLLHNELDRMGIE